MNRVLIICSVHHASGKATAAELYWLLGRLRPDVIFLERATEDFSAFLDGSCGTLESVAVLQYRKRNQVQLVPVDMHHPAVELKPKVDEMFGRLEEASPRYCQLSFAYQQQASIGGFAYLNSPDGALLQSEMQREMRSTVDAVGEPRLYELFALWTRTNDLRERAMIGGVEAFARQAPFKKGTLIVGAAHQQPLFEKSRMPLSDSPSAVAWDFDWQHEVTALDPRPDDDIANRDTRR